MTDLTELLEVLGVIGVTGLLAWIGFVAYWILRPFRPEATWFADLATLRTRLHQHQRRLRRRARPPLPVAQNLWPRAEIGPRMWRWPLNTTRHICARLWTLIEHRYGLPGVIARIAWYPATGIGAVVALIQAVLLVTVITLPMALLLLAVDSTTVIRGGMPPARRSHARKAKAAHTRRVRETQQRLATIRAQPGIDHPRPQVHG